MLELTGLVAGTVLVAIGVLHLLWLATPWPLASREELARQVVGRPGGDLPQIFEPLTVLVGLLLGVAGWLVADGAGLVPTPGPDWVVEAGVWVTGAVLLLRGMAGVVESGFRLGSAPDAYRRLDLRIYSPLCLALAALVLGVAAV